MSVKICSVIMKFKKYILFMALNFFLFFPVEGRGEGVAQIAIDTLNLQKIHLAVGKSTVIEIPVQIKRISLVDTEIADALVLTPRQIYLTGKAPGITSLTLWIDNKVHSVFDLEVTPNISSLKEKIHEILPEEKDIHVNATHDSITLLGTVSGTTNLSHVLALAEAYAPEKVINLLEVGGVHQVMLEVRVSEISRDLTKRLGLNFNYISSSEENFGLSMLNHLTTWPELNLRGLSSQQKGLPAQPLAVSDPVNAIFRFIADDTSWTVLIDALKEKGLVKILAEPTLITLSGQTANFLAGGEFPIPVPQELGRTTIDYKEFGVGLKFTPTVLSSGKINMKVAPEVSELNFSNAVVFGGFVIPSITTRRVSTMIELGDGQSFAIAGLLKDNVREIVTKFPVLGELPILGPLFRSNSFQKNETELIIIVTPHLVKPLDLAKQTLPTDQYIEPDDFEFYLLGNLEGKEKIETLSTSSPEGPTKEGGLEGEFGHITPE